MARDSANRRPVTITTAGGACSELSPSIPGTSLAHALPTSEPTALDISMPEVSDLNSIIDALNHGIASVSLPNIPALKTSISSSNNFLPTTAKSITSIDSSNVETLKISVPTTIGSSTATQIKPEVIYAPIAAFILLCVGIFLVFVWRRNWLYYREVKATPRIRVVSIDSFSHEGIDTVVKFDNGGKMTAESVNEPNEHSNETIGALENERDLTTGPLDECVETSTAVPLDIATNANEKESDEVIENGNSYVTLGNGTNRSDQTGFTDLEKAELQDAKGSLSVDTALKNQEDVTASVDDPSDVYFQKRSLNPQKSSQLFKTTLPKLLPAFMKNTHPPLIQAYFAGLDDSENPQAPSKMNLYDAENPQLSSSPNTPIIDNQVSPLTTDLSESNSSRMVRQSIDSSSFQTENSHPLSTDSSSFRTAQSHRLSNRYQTARPSIESSSYYTAQSNQAPIDLSSYQTAQSHQPSSYHTAQYDPSIDSSSYHTAKTHQSSIDSSSYHTAQPQQSSIDLYENGLSNSNQDLSSYFTIDSYSVSNLSTESNDSHTVIPDMF